MVFCSFAEQIRQIHKGLKDQIKLYQALQLFDNKANSEFYQYCIDNNIKFSRTKVQNMQRCKEEPGLPKEARFVLDLHLSTSKLVILRIIVYLNIW